jgi:hypothetical protein
VDCSCKSLPSHEKSSISTGRTDKPALAKIILNAHELFKIVEFFRLDSFMLFNCCIVSALKHLFNGHVLSALHLFIGHKNDLIQWCFVFMSQIHMTLGRFAGA